MQSARARLVVAALILSVSPALVRAGEVPLQLRGMLTLDQAANDPPEEQKPTSPPATSYGMSGNWNGLRDSLVKQHLYLDGFVLLDTSKVLRGGLDTEAWPVSYLLDLHLTADLEGIAGWTGAIAFVDFQSHDQSEGGDAAVGDFQGYDNITSPRFVQVAQLWYKQHLGDVARLKIGKIDANADAGLPDGESSDGFSLIEHSLDFLHSAAVYSPTMFPMATYPVGAPGVALFAGKDLYAGVGTFYENNNQSFLTIAGRPQEVQAAAGGMFSIGEAGARWTLGTLAGHAAVGGWFHSGQFARNDGTGWAHAGGAYLFADQSLFHEEGETVRDVGVFAIVGIADKTTSPSDRHLTVGISAAGLMPGRPDDTVGVMGSVVHFPSALGTAHPYELAAEAYYKIQLTPWASLKPDLQYIVHPSGVLPDAAVATLRVELDF